MINDQNTNTTDEKSGKNTLETFQNVEKMISKLTESIEVSQGAKHALDEKENKTPEELTKRLQIEEGLDRELKELNRQINLANQLVMKMQEETYNLINSDDGCVELKQTVPCITNGAIKNPNDSSGELHGIIMLNHDSKMKMLPHIMGLEPMQNKYDGCQTTCQCGSSFPESDCSDGFSCCCQSSDDIEKCIETDKSCVSSELDNALLKNRLCELKECLQNIVNENQELCSKLRDTVERNNSLAQALKLPAPFKVSSTGEIRFPGKKAMEEKLLFLKNEIIQLNKDMGVLQINRLKLKSAQDYIVQYNNVVTHCQCESLKPKETIETTIKVKKQKIKHITSQLRQMHNELKKTSTNYDSTVKANHKVITKNDKMSDCIKALNKKIEEYSNVTAASKELKEDLNKKNEEIETMELIIRKRTDEMEDCDEKLRREQAETNEISAKTNKLEDALKNLNEDFNAAYSNLESVFQEQLEEMMALPLLLKVTHVKLQEENDTRVLAEETRDKLERKIKEVESKKTPIDHEEEAEKRQDEASQISILIAENQAFESRLKYLRENVISATARLDQATRELDAVNIQVQNASAESIKHINAFYNFSTMHTERLALDVRKMQELLMKLHSKECAKALNKAEVMDQLKSNIESIYRNVEECKLEMHMFMDQSI